MATTDTDDRLLEQARGLAVSLEAELALVGSLVLAANERGQLDHGLTHSRPSRGQHECPVCQLLAWARASA